MKNKILIVALLSVAGAVSAGLIVMNNNNISEDISATINGYVHIGPTCPVIQFGSEEDCTDRPYSVTIEIHYPDERLHSTVRSGEDGMFSATLPAGEYILRPQLANILPACEEKRVTALADQTIQVDISCDSGIRSPVQPSPAPSAECRPTGCSGQVCSDEDVITTCEYRPEYACYQNAKCERQPNDSCGWTETAELTSCLSATGQ